MSNACPNSNFISNIVEYQWQIKKYIFCQRVQRLTDSESCSLYSTFLHRRPPMFEVVNGTLVYISILLLVVLVNF